MAMPISVRVQPDARKSELLGFSDGVWQVKVSAPPVKGKANAALIALLSDVLGVGKSQLSIIKGHTSRHKVVAVHGLSEVEITKRLSSSAASSR